MPRPPAPSGWWGEQEIDLRTRTSVMKLDTAAKEATLSSKEVVAYDSALLPAGANVRLLNVEGAHLEGRAGDRSAHENERDEARHGHEGGDPLEQGGRRLRQRAAPGGRQRAAAERRGRPSGGASRRSICARERA